MENKKKRGRPLTGTNPKVPINLRIQPELKEKAKELNLNLSEILEEALKQKFSQIDES